MKWKDKRLLVIAAGVYLLILIVASLIILVFFPELLPHRSESQREATTEVFVMGLDRATEYWEQHRDFDMILITEDGEIYLIGIVGSVCWKRNARIRLAFTWAG